MSYQITPPFYLIHMLCQDENCVFDSLSFLPHPNDRLKSYIGVICSSTSIEYLHYSNCKLMKPVSFIFLKNSFIGYFHFSFARGPHQVPPLHLRHICRYSLSFHSSITSSRPSYHNPFQHPSSPLPSFPFHSPSSP